MTPFSDRPRITLTGIDEATDINAVSHLDAEIAILYSAKGAGAGGLRYPSREWIANVIPKLPFPAVHICGATARQQLLSSELTDITDAVGRIQVNGIVSGEELKALNALYPGRIIVQYTDDNKHLCDIPVQSNFLVDSSGGRGISPDAWPRLPSMIHNVGFAGGLGLDNLAKELPKILRVAATGWWVDMESKLRVDDRFSVALAEECVVVYQAVLAS